MWIAGLVWRRRGGSRECSSLLPSLPGEVAQHDKGVMRLDADRISPISVPYPASAYCPDRNLKVQIDFVLDLQPIALDCDHSVIEFLPEDKHYHRADLDRWINIKLQHLDKLHRLFSFKKETN